MYTIHFTYLENSNFYRFGKKYCMFKFNDDQKKEKETQDTYMNPLAFLIDTLTKEGFGVFNIPRLSL